MMIAFSVKILWYGSTECNVEEHFSTKWNTEWKIFSMEWKWNGRKLPVRNTEKSSSISFHTILCLWLCLLSEGIFLAFEHCKIEKEKNQAVSKLNNSQKSISIACAEQQELYDLERVVILLANTKNH